MYILHRLSVEKIQLICTKYCLSKRTIISRFNEHNLRTVFFTDVGR